MQCPILVNNTNLHPISHCFQVITDYWSNLRFRQGCPSYTLVRGEPLNSRPQEPKSLLCRVVQNAPLRRGSQV